MVTIKAAFLNRSAISLSKKARGRGYSLLWAECLSANALGRGGVIKERETTGNLEVLANYQGLS